MYKLSANRMTASVLRHGFEQMPRPFPAAILFGLDSNSSAQNTICLTRADASFMRDAGMLSAFSCHILDSQPAHIASAYVFWREFNGKPMPLFGMEQLIFDVFGLTWGELDVAYSRMIWIDEDADRLDFEAALLQK